jgi:hypothetical protein
VPKPEETIRTLALAAAVTAVAVVVATPVCIAISGVDGCEAFACELLSMRRPHADISYCESWFDLFR